MDAETWVKNLDPIDSASPDELAREHEVLCELMEGRSNKEVAARLNLSPRTVEAHRAALFAKLGVSSLVQAIREYDKLQSV